MPGRILTAALAVLAVLLPPAPADAAGEEERLVVRLAGGKATEVASAAGATLGKPVTEGVWRLRVPAGRAAAALARLQRDRRVVWAERDVTVRATLVPNDPCLHERRDECGDVEQWGLHRVGTLAAWDVTQGDPAVSVAVLDSGVDADHPDLGDAVVGRRR